MHFIQFASLQHLFHFYARYLFTGPLDIHTAFRNEALIQKRLLAQAVGMCITATRPTRPTRPSPPESLYEYIYVDRLTFMYIFIYTLQYIYIYTAYVPNKIFAYRSVSRACILMFPHLKIPTPGITESC